MPIQINLEQNLEYGHATITEIKKEKNCVLNALKPSRVMESYLNILKSELL